MNALLALGRPREALALLDAAGGVPDAVGLRLRGRALRALGRHFDAEAALRDALALHADDAATLADLATTLLAQGRGEEARRLAGQACALQPQVAAWHGLRGVAADHAGHVEEAEEALARARAMSPGDAQPHAMYGWHALRDGRADDAASAFHAALAIDAACPEALRGVARVRALRDDWEGARTAWLDALAVDPMQVDARLGRSLALGDARLRLLRRVAAVPLWKSVLLALVAGLPAFLLRAVPGARGLAAVFALVAVAPPLARLLLARYARRHAMELP